MKTLMTTALCTLIFVPVTLGAQPSGPDPRARMCNQQGREIALRLSEEISDKLDARDRQQVAAIAEEVCLSFGPPAGAEPRRGRDNSESAEPADAEDGNTLPGGLRIIDPEDRVQRPGLKRR